MIKAILKLINFCIIIGVLIGIYSFFIEPQLLISKTNQITLDTLEDELTVIHFSDTHISDYYSLERLEKLIKNINEKEPDIIVFTGDLIDTDYDEYNAEEISKVLGKLNAKLGKFAVYGNHDISKGRASTYEKIMTDSNFILLRNNSFLLKVDEHTNINIIGLDDASIGKPDYSISETLASDESINLMIMHAADPVDIMNLSNIQIILSGHSHGGQINLPFLYQGVLPRNGRKYIKGLYELNSDTILFVSSGIGTTRIPVRFLNPPEFIIHKIA